MARDTGRGLCPSCHGQIVTVYVTGRKTLVDWPRAEHGDVAIQLTVTGAWEARHVPVGEAVRLVEKRYRVHACGEPRQDISEPQHAPEPYADRVRAAQAALARDKRSRRGRRPPKPITGYRLGPGGP